MSLQLIKKPKRSWAVSTLEMELKIIADFGAGKHGHYQMWTMNTAYMSNAYSF